MAGDAPTVLLVFTTGQTRRVGDVAIAVALGLLPRIIHEAWASESVPALIRDPDALKRSLWFSSTR